MVIALEVPMRLREAGSALIPRGISFRSHSVMVCSRATRVIAAWRVLPQRPCPTDSAGGNSRGPILRMRCWGRVKGRRSCGDSGVVLAILLAVLGLRPGYCRRASRELVPPATTSIVLALLFPVCGQVA